ncbi:hypothetical protein EIN_369330 [Entamoeba invadens IP1]|uniref:Uncharacterized protein n=1 Tax=Entamoeba invadens IP1 TaxID=370355 RepID=A0A0A1UBK8_ENTIV|nr:hypothetical protein EIN_369330 [Entamoeba invadens IP1]ELP92611.1 hypothetical protein EIN_369330 [Entamoeba invadens IP1]|eukprot:XP_004259382.1 hypothetical protein EIN_369330 [Entamoeba invadens IP1]
MFILIIAFFSCNSLGFEDLGDQPSTRPNVEFEEALDFVSIEILRQMEAACSELVNNLEYISKIMVEKETACSLKNNIEKAIVGAIEINNEVKEVLAKNDAKGVSIMASNILKIFQRTNFEDFMKRFIFSKKILKSRMSKLKMGTDERRLAERAINNVASGPDYILKFVEKLKEHEKYKNDRNIDLIRGRIRDIPRPYN